MRSDAADNREKPARSPHVARRNAPPANAAAEASAAEDESEEDGEEAELVRE